MFLAECFIIFAYRVKSKRHFFNRQILVHVVHETILMSLLCNNHGSLVANSIAFACLIKKGPVSLKGFINQLVQGIVYELYTLRVKCTLFVEMSSRKDI